VTLTAAPEVRPILKWAGGKRRLVPALAELLPSDFHTRRYVEPFAGGAAMFFALAPCRALLADINADLVALYRAVRDDPASVAAHLIELERAHSAAHFYDTRARYNARSYRSEAELAAWFVYLNKTCFNGLYRVNRQGHFNVPHGRYAAPTIADAVALRAASERLQSTHLAAGDFATTLRDAGAGDFAYLDPPYVPTSPSANFCGYAAAGFAQSEQERLCETFRALDRRGARVLLSNSDTPLVRRLYRGYRLHPVLAHRCVSSRSGSRGLARELVVLNYEPRLKAELA
jgi:DNA adenine methylase